MDLKQRGSEQNQWTVQSGAYTSALRHPDPHCRRRARVNRKYYTSNPACVITGEERDCTSRIPAIALGTQQASLLSRLAGFLTHASSIHHRRVQHLQNISVRA